MPITSRKTRRFDRPFFVGVFFLLILLFAVALAAAVAQEPEAAAKRILELYTQHNLAQADLALEAFETEHPASSDLPALWLARARAQSSSLLAIPLFRKVAESAPESEQAASALWDMAQLFYIAGNQTAAAAEAKRFIERFGRHARVPEAMLMLAALDAQAGRFRMAANRYAEVTVRFPDSDRAAEALVGLGDCKFRIDDFSGAQTAYRKALEKRSLTIDPSKVYYQLGLIAHKRKRPAESRRYYMVLIRNFPESRYTKQAKEALAARPLGRRTDGITEQTLPPLTLPSSVYAICVGAHPTREEAERFAEQFRKAGHAVVIHPKDGRFQVMVGRFSGRMDAYFFAEQLEKKFNVKTDIQPLAP